jgi:AcrR family transcriptional regulator
METTTHQDKNMKNKIMQRAAASFMKYGFRSVSMDDIARDMGISKKTLYQYFENKEDLILQTVNAHIEEEKCHGEEIIKNAQNALQCFLLLVKQDIKEFKEISPSAIYDLKKYYSEAWSIIQDLQRGHGVRMILENLQRGIAEGLYRTDFNPEIVARMHVGGINGIFDEDLFPRKNFQFDQVFIEYIYNFLRGIVSEKGLAKLQEYLVEMKKEKESL